MWIFPLLIVAVTLAAAFPVGRYLAVVMDGQYRPPRALGWLDRGIDTGPQSWRGYAIALLVVNTVMFGLGFIVLALQPLHPAWLNPAAKGALAPTTIFHTTISFVTNNSLQHYAGEQHLSYGSQLVAIIWNMFLSGGTGLASLAAFTRGLRGGGPGNFYLDLWRAVAYVLFPLSVILGVLLVGLGVPMTFANTEMIQAVEGGDSAQQMVARGPVAALVPVKNLASVGGGFFGANSAHPFENPGAFSNLLQIVSILLIPVAAVVMFGRMLGLPRHAAVLFGVMAILLVGMFGWVLWWDALHGNPALAGREPFPVRAGVGENTVNRTVSGRGELPVDQKLGNLEGKELRFGPEGASAYVTATMAVSCGSVNCMHDSLNPLAQLAPLTGMWLNCVFGGKGIGLINLLIYLIVAVFLGGLMVGRTPEYLGKKVEAREMKLAMLTLLIHPLLILAPTAGFLTTGWGPRSMSNPGTHGFTQVVYEFSSSAAGNGSGMEGLADTCGLVDSTPAPYGPHWDIATGLVMILGRYVPILAALALAGSLAPKSTAPMTVGTLRTDTLTFGVVLLGITLLLGALMFLPVMALGPIAEYLGPVPFVP
jgi:potassium-transporting ATPase potassium-binding subunit